MLSTTLALNRNFSDKFEGGAGGLRNRAHNMGAQPQFDGQVRCDSGPPSAVRGTEGLHGVEDASSPDAQGRSRALARSG